MSAVHEANTVSERELLRPRFGPFLKDKLLKVIKPCQWLDSLEQSKLYLKLGSCIARSPSYSVNFSDLKLIWEHVRWWCASEAGCNGSDYEQLDEYYNSQTIIKLFLSYSNTKKSGRSLLRIIIFAKKRPPNLPSWPGSWDQYSVMGLKMAPGVHGDFF